jgi:hypothetical protein
MAVERSTQHYGVLLPPGTDIAEQYRQAAEYIDQILKGAQAGQLPVQTPTKYEMVINLKTAKALGLEIPPNSNTTPLYSQSQWRSLCIELPWNGVCRTLRSDSWAAIVPSAGMTFSNLAPAAPLPQRG